MLPREILEGIKSELAQSMTEEEIEVLLLWYESDIGKEITLAEERASTAEAYQKMMLEAQSLLSNSKLIESAQRIDLLMGATENALLLQEFTGVALYQSMMTLLYPNEPLNLELFKEYLTAQRAEARMSIQLMFFMSCAYAYRDIEVEKLTEYEAFLNKPSSKKFNYIVTLGLNIGLQRWVYKWADQLARIVNKELLVES
jgi:hypothetical protein